MTTETTQETVETTETTPAQESPELLAGKFKTQEDLVQAYQNLESKLGAPKEEPVAPTDPAPQIQIPESAVEETGLTMDRLQELSADYAANGNQLSDEQYDRLLKENGIDRPTADHFIGREAQHTQDTRTRLLEPLGGEGGFEKVNAWALKNLDQGMIDQINTALAGDENSANMAVNMLKTQYETANGESIDLLTGRTSGVTNTGYESKAQWLRDVADPLYKQDPAFRAKVSARRLISNF